MIMKTDRLILRKMRRNDAENLLEIFSDPTAMEYYPSTKNEKQTLQWIDWTIDNYEKHGTGLWVAEHKQTGEFLGQCGIVPQEVEGSNEMEIGYLFKRNGFESFHLKKIVSLPDAKNLPSRKVAERIGMTLEKTIHKWGKEIAVYSVYC